MTTREKWLRCLFSFLCGSGLALGNLFCLISSNGITVREPYVAAVCVLSAAVFSILFIRKKPWGLALGLLGGVIFFELMRWRVSFGGALETARIVLRHVGNEYPDLLRLAQEIRVPLGASPTAFLAFLGFLLAVLTAATLSRGWTLLPLAGISGALLVPCFIMLYPLPRAWAVALLITVYGLMALTAAARRRHAAGAEGKALLLILPLALLGAFLLYQVHPQDYSYPAWSIRLEEKLEALTDRLPDLWELTFGRNGEKSSRGGLVRFSQGDSPEQADLAELSGGAMSDETVMTVRSTQNGLLYLRGCAYRHYTGQAWLGSGEEDAYPFVDDAFWVRGSDRNRLEIRMENENEMVYLPYGVFGLPDGSRPMEDLYVESGEGLTDYVLQYRGWTGTGEENEAEWKHFYTALRRDYDLFAARVYGRDSLPQDIVFSQDTGEELFRIISTILENVQVPAASATDYRAEAARAVADYVRNCAPYDLFAPQMPRDEEDFVTWFLTKGESGFCVHYATAAAVLLRAMGVPARFVTGYVVEAREGTWTVVAGRNAHAWVEYAAGDGTWTLLDPTPGAAERAEELTAYVTEAAQTPEEEEDDPEDMDDPEDRTDDETEDDDGDERENAARPELLPYPSGRRPLPLWAKIVLYALLALILWQILLRVVRRRMLHCGDPNRRAVNYWKHIRRLAKLSGTPVSQEIEDLALKARFSQHVITEEELRMLEERAQALREWMLTGTPVRGFLYRLLWAL